MGKLYRGLKVLWPIKWRWEEHIMNTVLAISLSRANQIIPFHVFQFSGRAAFSTYSVIWATIFCFNESSAYNPMLYLENQIHIWNNKWEFRPKWPVVTFNLITTCTKLITLPFYIFTGFNHVLVFYSVIFLLSFHSISMCMHINNSFTLFTKMLGKVCRHKYLHIALLHPGRNLEPHRDQGNVWVDRQLAVGD